MKSIQHNLLKMIDSHILKGIFFLFAVLLSTSALYAQSPGQMSYQMVVRDASGALVSEKQVNVMVTILKGSPGGTLVFGHGIRKNTNKNGLITISLGDGSGYFLQGSISGIDWEQGPYFMKVEVDPQGGDNFTIENTSQILSVPYALYAKSGGGTTLDKTYRFGTAGEIGKITADKGAVTIEGKDGLLVKGVTTQGATIASYTGSGYQPKMYFNPKKGAFRAGNIANNYWDDPNVGAESTAFGRGPLASGESSFAAGVFNEATGFASLATGNSTKASGYISTAMGYFSSASGYNATAFGRSTVAAGEYSTAMGFRSKASGNWSTALGDSSEANGLGTMAFGHKNIATGPYSTAMGFNNNTLGNYSIAMGYGNNATKGYGIAIGFQNEASGYYESSTAIGYQNTASGDGSTALGLSSIASGKWSTAMGRRNTASGQNSFAIGNSSFTSGLYSGSFGNSNNVTGKNSVAIGSYVKIEKDGVVAFGDGVNDDMEIIWPNSFVGRFEHGYWFYTGAQVGLYVHGGDNSWSTISDSTKKENLLPVDGKDVLNKISTMKLVSWNYIGQNPKDFRHYGPMAQEFHSNFGHDKLGKIGNDSTINQSDFAGISFIAIKELIKENQESKAHVASLNDKVSGLQTSLTALKIDNEALKSELSAEKNQSQIAIKMLEEKFENLNKALAVINATTGNSVGATVKRN